VNTEKKFHASVGLARDPVALAILSVGGVIFGPGIRSSNDRLNLRKSISIIHRLASSH
jgi:hypothetical protein